MKTRGKVRENNPNGGEKTRYRTRLDLHSWIYSRRLWARLIPHYRQEDIGATYNTLEWAGGRKQRPLLIPPLPCVAAVVVHP